MKIVINKTHGGFSLSEQALCALSQRKGCKLELRDGFAYEQGKALLRHDPDLVAVVESLGTQASGPHARLKVVEIPDNVLWFVQDYDGIERVAEIHRSWG